jgi:hypothetical protein
MAYLNNRKTFMEATMAIKWRTTSSMALRELQPEELQAIMGGTFPVRVGWQLLKHATRMGDSSADAWHARYAAQEAANAAARAREAQQSQAQAWRAGHPDFFRTPTIQESLSQRWDRLGHQLAVSGQPYHPQLRPGHP